MKLAKELEQLKYDLGSLGKIECSDGEAEEYRNLQTPPRWSNPHKSRQFSRICYV